MLVSSILSLNILMKMSAEVQIVVLIPISLMISKILQTLAYH